MSAKCIRFTLILAAFVAAPLLLGSNSARAEDSHDMAPLVQALSKSKLTLLQGVRQAKDHGVVISAKFELEDGKLSLSVYTAEKGLSTPAEKNVLEELSGSPEEKWEPKVEVFKDVEHISRSAEQLAIVAMGRTSVADLIARVQKAQGGTVLSVKPMIKNHKPVAEVLVANKGKVTTLVRPL
jgi:predicted nucleic acid-binding OB-fold protein